MRSRFSVIIWCEHRSLLLFQLTERVMHSLIFVSYASIAGLHCCSGSTVIARIVILLRNTAAPAARWEGRALRFRAEPITACPMHRILFSLCSTIGLLNYWPALLFFACVASLVCKHLHNTSLTSIWVLPHTGDPVSHRSAAKQIQLWFDCSALHVVANFISS